MHKLALGMVVAMLVAISGCAFLKGIAPAVKDEAGTPVLGTHALTPTAEVVVGATGPYGQAAAGVVLLVWNFVERFRRKKTESGLIATVKALKQAGSDPATKAEFDKVKTYLANAHEAADVTPLIKGILAKI